MISNEDIVSREISEDIEALNASNPQHKDCNFARAARVAIIRSLRIGETCMKYQKANTAMFILIVLSSLRVENKSVTDILLAALGKVLGL